MCAERRDNRELHRVEPGGSEQRHTFGQVHDALGWWIGKTDQGPLRYIHFLATAYLAWAAVGPRGSRLRGTFSIDGTPVEAVAAMVVTDSHDVSMV